MKIYCPRCEDEFEVNELDYEPGSTITVRCPHCRKQHEIKIPERTESESEVPETKVVEDKHDTEPAQPIITEESVNIASAPENESESTDVKSQDDTTQTSETNESVETSVTNKARKPKKKRETPPPTPKTPSAPKANITPPKKDDGNMALGCGCIIVILLLIVGAVGAVWWFFFRGDDDESAQIEATEYIEEPVAEATGAVPLSIESYPDTLYLTGLLNEQLPVDMIIVFSQGRGVVGYAGRSDCQLLIEGYNPVTKRLSMREFSSSGDNPAVYSGTLSGDTYEGKMNADKYNATFTLRVTEFNRKEMSETVADSVSIATIDTIKGEVIAEKTESALQSTGETESNKWKSFLMEGYFTLSNESVNVRIEGEKTTSVDNEYQQLNIEFRNTTFCLTDKDKTYNLTLEYKKGYLIGNVHFGDESFKFKLEKSPSGNPKDYLGQISIKGRLYGFLMSYR